jgi:glycosyltransferase involved in cell wall biosynthesis
MYRRTYSFIISFIDSTGLAVDAEILKMAIEQSGIPIDRIRLYDGRHSKFRKLVTLLILLLEKYLFGKKQIAIHIESINTKIKSHVKTNVLIPNQEWFSKPTEQIMDDNIHVWCKTHYATDIFSPKFPLTSYIGFCSRNFFDEAIKQQSKKFLHVAGKSHQKGTGIIMEVWKKHPDWPELVVICRTPEINVHTPPPNNINIITDFISEAELLSLLNRCDIHLCLSETEGFGHYIHEGMSAGAIIVTTNAPPMNEFINKDCGFLVSYDRQEKQGYSNTYIASSIDFEKTVNRILRTPTSQLNTLSNNSLNTYLDNKEKFLKQFSQNLKNLINEL